MSRSPIADRIEHLLRERLPLGPLEDGRMLELRSCYLGHTEEGLGPPGPADEIEAVLCLRRGGSLTAPLTLVQLIMPGYEEYAPALGVPLLAPDGWYVVEGQCYDAAELEADIAARLGRWVDTCCASTLARMSAPDPEEDEPPAALLDTRDGDEILAPARARPITARRGRVLEAEVDGQAIRLAAGGVLVWPDDGDVHRARAYLTLDDEEVAVEGPVRRGQRLIRPIDSASGPVSGPISGSTLGPTSARVSRAFDARGPIEVDVRAGDVIGAGDVVARADGRDFTPGVAGTIVRVELYDHDARDGGEADGYDDGARHRPALDPVFAEVHGAARRAATEALVQRAARELAGRVLRYKLLDDTGRILGRPGEVVQLPAAPAMSQLLDIAASLDDAALEDRLRRLEAEADDLPMFRPPAWLPRRHPLLARGARHRLRLLIAAEATP